MRINQQFLLFQARANRLNISIRRLCQLADIYPMTFRRIRDGKNKPNYETIQRIENVLSNIEKRKLKIIS